MRCTFRHFTPTLCPLDPTKALETKVKRKCSPALLILSVGGSWIVTLPKFAKNSSGKNVWSFGGLFTAGPSSAIQGLVFQAAPGSPPLLALMTIPLFLACFASVKLGIDRFGPAGFLKISCFFRYSLLKANLLVIAKSFDFEVVVFKLVLCQIWLFVFWPFFSPGHAASAFFQTFQNGRYFRQNPLLNLNSYPKAPTVGEAATPPKSELICGAQNYY